MPSRLRPSRRPTAPRERRGPAWAASVPGPTDSLPDQVEQFLDWLRVQRNRPGTTVRAYRQDLAKFVAFLRTRPLASDLLAGVDRPVLRRYQIELADVLPNPRSRARALVALRRFLAYAYDEGWIGGELSRQVSRAALRRRRSTPGADRPRAPAARRAAQGDAARPPRSRPHPPPAQHRLPDRGGMRARPRRRPSRRLSSSGQGWQIPDGLLHR